MEKKSTKFNKQTIDNTDLICDLCKIKMVMKEATFEYLGRTLKHKVLRCPSCGQVYVSEDLAKGRMSEVESLLEDK